MNAASPLNQLFAQHHEYKRHHYPEMATYEGDYRYNNRLTDLSTPAIQERHHLLQGFRQQLRDLPREGWSEADALNADLFALMLDQDLKEHAWDLDRLALDQMHGLHLFLPQLINFHPFRHQQDFVDYNSRLMQVEQQMGHVISHLQRGMTTGMVLPRLIAEKILPQLASLKDATPTESLFAQPLQKAPDLSASLKTDILNTIQTRVLASYQRLYDFMQTEYIPACRSTVGLWALPEGEDIYQFLIEKYTAPGLTADEIHELGLSEVKRISEQQAQLRQELNFKGSVDEFHQFLRTDPQFFFTSEADLLAAYNEIMETAYGHLPTYFGKLPAAPCELKPVEPYRSQSSPQAFYYPAPEDRSRPGYYYINTYDLPARPKHAMTALTLHEAVPGHHLQIALAQEMTGVPKFRQKLHITAFLEGWGLYSEYLGYEMGMLKDPYQHYGALSFEIWRACRLVVDTGLHAKKWSKQQACDFMRQHMANTEPDIQAEVDRYMVLPGQALSYKVGEIKIKGLRRQMEALLGDQFDIRAFHDALLSQGALPLAVLEQHMQQWLKQIALHSQAESHDVKKTL